ncbi:MAG: N-acetylglucosamine kinase, partial [Nocardioidaceae bacterium]
FGDVGNAGRLVELFAHVVPEAAATPLAIGAHGCDVEDQCTAFERAVSAVWPGPVRVVNDAQLLAPAYGVDESIAMIVGTGSIVTGVSDGGEAITAGGHGWLLDDPGSAPGIAREAVRAVLHALDTARPRDGLAEALLTAYGVEHEVDLSYSFTNEPSIGAWASLAPTVFAAADAGSALAAEVVDAAAAQLADSVADVRRRGATGSTVVVAGGVITNQPRLLDAVRTHVRAYDPRLDVRLLNVAPVRGALELARRMQETKPNNRGGIDETRQAVQ